MVCQPGGPRAETEGCRENLEGLTACVRFDMVNRHLRHLSRFETQQVPLSGIVGAFLRTPKPQATAGFAHTTDKQMQSLSKAPWHPFSSAAHGRVNPGQPCSPPFSRYTDLEAKAVIERLGVQLSMEPKTGLSLKDALSSQF